VGRLWRIKAKRFARMWWRVTWSSTIAPLTEASARLQYLTAVALVLFILPPYGFVRWREHVQSLTDLVLACILAVPVFFLWNCCLAVFKVRAEENKLGAWHVNKFIYYSKLPVRTFVVSAEDNDSKLLFKVDDPEIGSLVDTIVEIDRHDDSVRALVLWPHDNLKGDLRGITRQTQSSLRLPKDRTLWLKTYAEPEVTPTIIRVYISSWTIYP